MVNKAFWRALHSITHPVSCLAVILLLINDHWLRHTYPSWLTGKLGDFTWLVFAPFICAALFAWLIPAKFKHHERIVGLSAIGFIGVWFATAKTLPAVHALTITALDAIAGWHGSLGMDTTDLMTLPALLITWQIWQTSSSARPELPSLRWIIAALGIMGTVATSSGPVDEGITQICEMDNTLYAITTDRSYMTTTSYMSNDGGLTWLQSPEPLTPLPIPCTPAPPKPIPQQTWTMELTSAIYRFVPGEGIYLTEPGKIEKLEFDLSYIGHDSYKLLRQVARNGEASAILPSIYFPGPFDGLVDGSTGNMVLAMGHDGVLVKPKDGNWRWVAVGQYHYVERVDPGGILTLLQPELLTALFLFTLIPPTVGLTAETRRWYGTLTLGILWTCWTTLTVFKGFFLDLLVINLLGIPIAVAVLILNGWVMEVHLFRRLKPFRFAVLLVLALNVALLFLLPYMLWSRRTLPNHSTASTFALLLSVAGVYSAGRYFRWRFPPGKKKKKDEDLDDEKPKHDDLFDDDEHEPDKAED